MHKKIISFIRLTNVSLRCFSRTPLDQIPMLNEFIAQKTPKETHHEPLTDILNHSNLMDNVLIERKKFHIETYGCQMNESDSEIINSILTKAGYEYTKELKSADIVLMNTCAIREGAENRIWGRLNELRVLKTPSEKPLILGVLGCMATRLKEKLLEKAKIVDLIAGPDAYRDLPQLLLALDGSSRSMNVQLSADETYADIRPIRFRADSPQAYVSIMRGCNNMCSFCIVPFTRGRERSRPLESIIDEIKGLRDQGIKEITLLGQNVNSYHDRTENSQSLPHQNSEGFREMYKLRSGEGWRFENLLQKAAETAPEVRFRFTSPHPKDFPKGVLEIIRSYPNICKQIHLPAQSGSTAVLTRMRRNYSKEAYLGLVETIREIIPDVALSTDLISGFCRETEEEFRESVELLEKVQYDQAFLFAYSMREKTHAHRNYKDDVPEEVKLRRLRELIDLFLKIQEKTTKNEIGRLHLVLVEGPSGPKFPGQLKGRTDTNKRVLLKQTELFGFNENLSRKEEKKEIKKGDYVLAFIEETTRKSLFGKGIGKMNLKDFAVLSGKRAFVDKDKTKEVLLNFEKA